MATKTTRRGSSNRRRGSKISQGRIASNAMETQKTINRDYKALVRDYGKLFRQLWALPATKYVVAGAAVAGLIPVAMRFIRSNPQISDFVRENMDAVEEKFDEVTEKVSEKISNLRGSQEDLSEARH